MLLLWIDDLMTILTIPHHPVPNFDHGIRCPHVKLHAMWFVIIQHKKKVILGLAMVKY
jgi:hypothetical protein